MGRTRFTLLAALLLATVVAQAGPAVTPSTGRGPFFPAETLADEDSDLRRVDGRTAPARGTPLHILGRILSADGNPVAGAEVFIWQTDDRGLYRHPDAPSTLVGQEDGELDPDFQYWGRTTSDAQGRYAFRTIVPGHYGIAMGARPNHVHYQVRHPEFRTLATELSFQGDDLHDDDFVTRHLSAAQRLRLQAVLESDPENAGGQRARHDIVLEPRR